MKISQMSQPSKLTSQERKELALVEGHGRVRVLAIGVEDYPKKSGFSSLRQCTTDASSVITTFTEVKQLNAHPGHLILMNKETTERPPTRGMILDQVHELAAATSADERLLLYFSGHGHRLTGVDDHFLVPSDAFSADDPTALVSMKQVCEILKTSAAKQKIIIIDACLSGPALLGAKLQAAKYSEKFFAEYMKKTKGFVLLSSRAAEEKSYTKSDNPKLSLFTFFLVKALRGEPDALDEHVLTIPKLFDYVSTEVQRKGREYRLQQNPGVENTADGTMVLGDFRRLLITSGPLNLKEHPLRGVLFQETYAERTKAILTEWKNRTRTPDQLEWAANTTEAMADYVKSDFDSWRPQLRRQFGFGVGDIDSDGGHLSFPGGSLSYKYTADSRDSGTVTRELSLDIDWFGDSARLLALLNIFGFQPDKVDFVLSASLVPMDQITGLESSEWEIVAESAESVSARKNGITMTVSSRCLSFEGLDIEELLEANDSRNEQQLLLASTFAAIAPAAGK